MAKTESPNLAVYVVWSSQLGAREHHVRGAAQLMPDSRARHYWDEQRAVGKAYQALLGLKEPAWDVFMLFDRGAVWTAKQPPMPAWWEHQLRDAAQELRLDPERFAAKGNGLLSAHRDPK